MMDDLYARCHSCNLLVDDGNFNNGEYLCHECLDDKKKLYQIAMNDKERMSDRYAAARELQDSNRKKGIHDDRRI